MVKNVIRVAVAALLIWGATTPLAVAAPSAELWPIWDRSNESNTATIDHTAWQKLLQQYLKNNHPSGVNRFDYGGVSEADAELLENYLQSLQDLDPREYSKAEQKAYWINFYNALTIQVILNEYPVKSILKTGEKFFSIGPWNDELVEVAGEELTLNDIEHRILRPIWKDARLHFAVNCASIGCPNLQQQVFTAANTEEMLDRAAQEYLSHSRGAQFDRKGRLVLSEIFDWYGVDFGPDEKSVIKAISQYAPEALAAKMRNHKGKVKYDYDWDLNKP